MMCRFCRLPVYEYNDELQPIAANCCTAGELYYCHRKSLLYVYWALLWHKIALAVYRYDSKLRNSDDNIPF